MNMYMVSIAAPTIPEYVHGINRCTNDLEPDHAPKAEKRFDWTETVVWTQGPVRMVVLGVRTLL